MITSYQQNWHAQQHSFQLTILFFLIGWFRRDQKHVVSSSLFVEVLRFHCRMLSNFGILWKTTRAMHQLIGRYYVPTGNCFESPNSIEKSRQSISICMTTSYSIYQQRSTATSIECWGAHRKYIPPIHQSIISCIDFCLLRYPSRQSFRFNPVKLFSNSESLLGNILNTTCSMITILRTSFQTSYLVCALWRWKQFPFVLDVSQF